MEKSEVRAIAERAGLATAKKKTQRAFVLLVKKFQRILSNYLPAKKATW